MSFDDETIEQTQPMGDRNPQDAETVVLRSAVSSGFALGSVILGRYELLSSLGSGAMGEVYLCNDLVSGLQIAIKRVPPELAHEKIEMDSIRENFKLVQKLNHPHLANVKQLEHDAERDEYYLIMEYVEGMTLRQMVLSKDPRLTNETIQNILNQCASALDYAHSQRVLHRDLKPANIMVSSANEVKILDFGIAGEIKTSLTRVTDTSKQVSGTGIYMAPEQWRGWAESGATDQYALAVTFFELIQGHVPFRATDMEVLREMVIAEPVLQPKDMSETTFSAFKKALDKDMKSRWPSCGAFAEAFAGKSVRSIPAHNRKWLAVGVAALLLAGLSFLGTTFLGSKNSETPIAFEPAQEIHIEPASGEMAVVSQNSTDETGWMRGSSLEWAPRAEAASGVLNYYAIVIGVNEYNEKAGWKNLSTARGDAEAVAEVLEKEYGFNTIRLFDEKATRSNIIAALDQLSSLDINDAAVVYYAGHGLYEDELGEGYWIPSEARMKSGTRLAKEDWVWNSTITKIIGASRARHILVMADSCYSGSLFRGGDPLDAITQNMQWYKRAIGKPSRYLITSGDLEPVLDSGAKHSIFAKQVLNFLQYPEKPVFSASDLGMAVRERVSSLTGQLVRMGNMNVASHAGGEFVFVRPGEQLPEHFTASVTGPSRGIEISVDAGSAIEQALTLHRQGAGGSAKKLLDSVPTNTTQKILLKHALQIVSQGTPEDTAFSSLLEKMKTQEGHARSNLEGMARPRILAAIGPESKKDDHDAESTAVMYQLCLSDALQSEDLLYVVDRSKMAAVLKEQEYSLSDLSDKRVQTAVGKLLPASMLLLGDVIPMKTGERVFLRLVDTESTEVFASVSKARQDDEDVYELCQLMTKELLSKIIQRKPLEAKLSDVKAGRAIGALGSFHKAKASMTFDLLVRESRPQGAFGGYIDTVVGSCALERIGELASDVSFDVSNEDAFNPDLLWIREQVQ